MNEQQYEQVIAYVTQRLQQGSSHDDVAQTLRQHGLNDETINDVLEQAQSRIQPQVQPEVPAEPVAPAQQQVAQSQVTNEASEIDNQPTPTPAAQPQFAAPAQSAATAEGAGVRKYRVFRAVNDAIEAISRNVKTFIGVTAITYAGVFVLFLILALVLGWFGQAFVSNFQMSIVALAFGLIFSLLLSVVASSFVVTTLAMIVMDGSEGRNLSIEQVLKRAAGKFGRVVLATAIQALIIAGPLLLAILAGVASVMALGGSAAIVGILLYLIATVWMIIAPLRFALIPYVALFEPETSLMKLPKRSNDLLKTGGQWFVFKGILLVLAVAMVVSAVTGQSMYEAQAGGGVVSAIIFAALSILMNSVLVMLYKNQRALTS